MYACMICKAKLYPVGISVSVSVSVSALVSVLVPAGYLPDSGKKS